LSIQTFAFERFGTQTQQRKPEGLPDWARPFVCGKTEKKPIGGPIGF